MSNSLMKILLTQYQFDWDIVHRVTVWIEILLTQYQFDGDIVNLVTILLRYC